MLSVNSYPQDYVDACRAGVGRLASTYAELTKAVSDPAAVAAFEPPFFNHMVLALDAYFCHRARGLEGKDGNPLNEVRVLCSSIMNNHGRLVADKGIKLKPETSILGYAVGDPIQLSASDFARLSGAFFAEIERRYP